MKRDVASIPRNRLHLILDRRKLFGETCRSGRCAHGDFDTHNRTRRRALRQRSADGCLSQHIRRFRPSDKLRVRNLRRVRPHRGESARPDRRLLLEVCRVLIPRGAADQGAVHRTAESHKLGPSISRRCQGGYGFPELRLAAVIDCGLLRWGSDSSNPVVSVEWCRIDPHQSPIRIKAVESGIESWPLTHKASQKRIGHTSACPMGITEAVAHRRVAGTLCGSRARCGIIAPTLPGRCGLQSDLVVLSHPQTVADRTDQAHEGNRLLSWGHPLAGVVKVGMVFPSCV